MPYDKIVLISLDTLRADGIGFTKDKLYQNEYKLNVALGKTKLDELCARSCFFSNAISAAPYTSASHAAYFSGKWPKNNGLFDQFNSKMLVENVFRKFKKQRYKTIFKTDFPFILGKYLNLIGGVDEYFIENDLAPLESLQREEKTLVFFHFGQIHYPYGFHSLLYAGDDYKNKVVTLEKKYGIESVKIDLEDMAIETFHDEEDLRYLYRYKKIISHLYKNKDDDDLFNLYLEGINYFHENKFNRFLEQLLTQLGGQNYLIVIFADHGEAWNDETYGHHNSLDEGVLRVPMAFFAKDIEPQYVRNRIRTIDLLPTLLEMNGFDDRDYDGKSLVGCIYDNKIEEDRDAFAAVWVNQSSDVLANIKELEKNNDIKTKNGISLKYSAAYYRKSYKYIENYKHFFGRSEKIEDFNLKRLYAIDNLTNMVQIQDEQLEKELSELIVYYNNILETDNVVGKSEQLKKYFRMQGYNV